MMKFGTTVRFAALGALALGLASAGFAVNASAAELKNVTDVASPGAGTSGPGGGSSGPNGAPGASGNAAGGGNAGAATGVTTGEGALASGSCFVDMPVYNKEGKFVGRGIVNTCN